MDEVASRWASLDEEAKEPYREKARKDKQRYDQEILQYKAKKCNKENEETIPLFERKDSIETADCSPIQNNEPLSLFDLEQKFVEEKPEVPLFHVSKPLFTTCGLRVEPFLGGGDFCDEDDISMSSSDVFYEEKTGSFLAQSVFYS